MHGGSDWAGDLLGKKKHDGVIIMRDKHLLRYMSCSQTLVALILRPDSRSVHELGHSATLSRSDDQHQSRVVSSSCRGSEET